MLRTSRAWPASVLLVALLLLGLAGCGSGSSAPATASPPVATTSSGPADVYLAIVASAADPNALEARRTSIVDALASERAMHVVLEQGACYPGIPSRYGDGYILAVWDAEEAPVRADLASAGVDAEWSGRATVTCLD